MIVVLVVVTALAALVARPSDRVKRRAFLAVLAAAAPVAIFVLGVAGKDVVISRYTAVGAPMLVIAIVAAAASLAPPWRVALAAAAAVAAGIGLVDSHRRAGFYAPARETVDYSQAHQRPGDVVVPPGHPGADVPLAYYGARRLHPLPPYLAVTDPASILAAAQQHARAWFIVEVAPRHYTSTLLLKLASNALQQLDYRPVQVSVFTTTTAFAVILAKPISG